MQTPLDCAVLVFFVACGISRLARYNATVQIISDEKGQIKYFEGTPVPTTLALTIAIGFLLRSGRIEEALPFGMRQIFGYRLETFMDVSRNLLGLTLESSLPL
jgi:CDP-diacylglycerol--serine O-phosphatidyltransferase